MKRKLIFTILMLFLMGGSMLAQTWVHNTGGQVESVNPGGIAIDAYNRLWTINTTTSQLTIRDLSGSGYPRTPTSGAITSLDHGDATIHTGGIYTLSSTGRGISVSPDGKKMYLISNGDPTAIYVIDVPIAMPSSTDPLPAVRIPTDMTTIETTPVADKDGNIVVLNFTLGQISAYNSSGQKINGITITGGTGYSYPREITMSPDGKDIYTSTQSTAYGVLHYHSDNGIATGAEFAFVKNIPSTGATAFPKNAIHLDQYGRLWIGYGDATVAASKVECYANPNTASPTPLYTIAAATSWANSRSISVSPDGTKFYVGGVGNGVREYSWTGASAHTLTGNITGLPAGTDVTLRLTDLGNNAYIETTVSGGTYSFPATEAGKSYTIAVVSAPPAGYTFTTSSYNTGTISGNSTQNFTAELDVQNYDLSINIAGYLFSKTVSLSVQSTDAAVNITDNSATFPKVIAVPDGKTYTVTPTLAGYTFSPLSQNITISGADASLPATFIATPDAPAAGTWNFSRVFYNGPVLGVGVDNSNRVWLSPYPNNGGTASQSLLGFNSDGTSYGNVTGLGSGADGTNPFGTALAGRGISIGPDGKVYTAYGVRAYRIDPDMRTNEQYHQRTTAVFGATPVSDGKFTLLPRSRNSASNGTDRYPNNSPDTVFGSGFAFPQSADGGLPGTYRDIAASADGKYVYTAWTATGNATTTPGVKRFYNEGGFASGQYLASTATVIGTYGAAGAEEVHVDQYGNLWVGYNGAAGRAARFDCWGNLNNQNAPPAAPLFSITSPVVGATVTAGEFATGAFSRPSGFWLSPDGTKAYIGDINYGVLEYTLGAAAVTHNLTIYINNTGSEGVRLTLSTAGEADVVVNNITTGSHMFTVQDGKTYTVTPFLSGYNFNPTSETITNITASTSRTFNATPVGQQPSGIWKFSRVFYDDQPVLGVVVDNNNRVWLSPFSMTTTTTTTQSLLAFNQDKTPYGSVPGLGIGTGGGGATGGSSANNTLWGSAITGKGISMDPMGKIYTTYNGASYRIDPNVYPPSNPTSIENTSTVWAAGATQRYGTTPVSDGGTYMLVGFASNTDGNGIERYLNSTGAQGSGYPIGQNNTTGLPDAARDMALSADGNYLYVACTEGGASNSGVRRWYSATGTSGTYGSPTLIGNYGVGAEEVHIDQYGNLWIGYNGAAGRAARFDCWGNLNNQDAPPAAPILTITSPVVGATVTAGEFATGAFSRPSGFWLSPDGTKAYIGDLNHGVIEYSLEPAYDLAVTITGTGSENVTLNLTGSTSATGTTTTGSYTFNVPNGSYTVTPTLAGYTFSPTSQNITISGANASLPVPFVGTAIPAGDPAILTVNINIGGVPFTGEVTVGIAEIVGGVVGKFKTIPKQTTTAGSVTFNVFTGRTYKVVPALPLGYKLDELSKEVIIEGASMAANFNVEQLVPPTGGVWKFSKVIHGGEGVQGVGVSSNGRIWVNPGPASNTYNSTHNNIFVYDSDGSNKQTLGATDYNGPNDNRGRGLSIGHDGKVYITRQFAICTVDPVTLNASTAINPYNGISATTAVADVWGNIVVANVTTYDYNVLAYDKDRDPIGAKITSSSGSRHPNLPNFSRHLATTPDGRKLYMHNLSTYPVLYWSSDDFIDDVDGSYTYQSNLGLGSSTGTNFEGLHLDQYGRFWTERNGSSTVNSVIECWDLSTNPPTRIASITSPERLEGTATTITTTQFNAGGFYQPRGLWLSNDGKKAYIADWNGGSALAGGVLEYEYVPLHTITVNINSITEPVTVSLTNVTTSQVVETATIATGTTSCQFFVTAGTYRVTVGSATYIFTQTAGPTSPFTLSAPVTLTFNGTLQETVASKWKFNRKIYDGRVAGVGVTSDDAIWINSYNDQKITVLNQDLTEKIPPSPYTGLGNENTSDASFTKFGRGLSIGWDGMVYASVNTRVYRINPQTMANEQTYTISSTGPVVGGPNYGTTPVSAGGGTMMVAFSNNSIFANVTRNYGVERYNDIGTLGTNAIAGSTSSTTMPALAKDIAISADGRYLYIACSDGSNMTEPGVTRWYNAAGAATGTYIRQAVIGNYGATGAEEVHIDAQGRLWVGYNGTDLRAARFDCWDTPSTTPVLVDAIKSAFLGEGEQAVLNQTDFDEGGFSQPRGLWFSPDGTRAYIGDFRWGVLEYITNITIGGKITVGTASGPVVTDTQIKIRLTDIGTSTVVETVNLKSDGTYEFTKAITGVPYRVQVLTAPDDPVDHGYTFSVPITVTLAGDYATADFVATIKNYTISGTVSGIESGYTVPITITPPPVSGPATQNVANDGNYSFTVQGLQNYTVSVPANIFNFTTPPPVGPDNKVEYNYTNLIGDQPLQNFVAGTGRQTATLSGTVKLENGDDVMEAIPIRYTNLTSNASTTITLSGGSYSFIATAGDNYFIEVLREPYFGYSFTPLYHTSGIVTADHHRDDLNFVAKLDQSTIGGTVWNGDQKLANVNVHISYTDLLSNPPVLKRDSMTTGPDGVYKFENLSATFNYTLWVSTEVGAGLNFGGFFPSTKPITLVGDRLEEDFMALSGELAELSGYVRTDLDNTGSGVNGISIRVECTHSSFTFTTTVATSQGPDGNGYYYMMLPAGYDYDVTGLVYPDVPFDQGYRTIESRTILKLPLITGARNINLLATLNEYSISGKVWNGNDPLEGVTVTLLVGGLAIKSQTTGTNGLYAFNELEALESYTVRVNKDGFTFATPSKLFENLIGNKANEDFHTALNSQSISGRITMGAQGIPNIVVRVTGTNASVFNGVTDIDGDYMVNVPAGVTYNITPLMVPDHGYTFSPSSFTVTSISDPFTANFTAGYRTYTISGYITNASMQPIAGVEVSCIGTISGVTTTRTTETNSIGYYSFSAQARGSYTIVPRLVGFSFSPTYRVYGEGADGLIGDRLDADFVESSAAASTLMATPTSLLFGSVLVSRTETRAVTITNIGNKDMKVVNLGFGGMDPTNFAHDFNNNTEVTLAPDASMVVRVSFTPSTMGAKNATLRVFAISADELETPYNLSVPLVGTGVSTLAEIADIPNIDFGTVILNSGVKSVVIDIVNLSPYRDDILSVTDIYYDDPTYFGIFAPEGFPGRPISISGATGINSQQITLTFSPEDGGPRSNTLRIINSSFNDANKAITVTVNVNVGSFVVSPSRVKFGTLLSGFLEQEVTIQNISTGSVTYTIDDIFITGVDATSFELLTSSGFPITVAPGQTERLTVRFAPSTIGAKSALLNISSDYDLAPLLQIPLDGEAGYPEIYTDINAIDFGTMYKGTYKDTTLVVSNFGSTDLIINSATFTGTGANMFSVISPARFPLTIRPSSEGSIVIRALAMLPNEDKAVKLTLNNNDPTNRQYMIDLSATVTSAILSANIRDERIIFDSITVGYRQDTTVIFKNEGDIPLYVTRFELAGAYSSEFTVDVAAPFTLESGETKVVNVTFRPLAEGQRYAVINTSVNDPVRPNPRITLQGWGVDQGAVPHITFDDGEGETASEWDFGTVPVRETRTKDLFIKNLSRYGVLRIDNMAFNHLEYQPFSFGNLTFPLLIEPNDSLPVTLSFTPNDRVRYYEGNLTIQYSDLVKDPDPDNNLQLLLKGTVVFPNVSIILPQVLEFGKINQGDTLTRKFDMTNTSLTYLMIDSIVIVGEDASDFTLVNTTLPQRIEQDIVYQASVRFIAGNIGSKDAKIYVYNNDLFGAGYGANEIIIMAESKQRDENAIDVKLLDEIPTVYNLYQNYPNPFNPTTKIEYAIPEASKVRLVVYNSLGQEVATLINEEQAVGRYRIDFNASNLPSGIYFYRIQADKFISVKKMMLLK